MIAPHWFSYLFVHYYRVCVFFLRNMSTKYVTHCLSASRLRRWRASRHRLQTLGTNHHCRLLQRVIPSPPTEPDDALPGGQVLRIVQIQAVQTSTAWLPPPATLWNKTHNRQLAYAFIILCSNEPWACWRNSASCDRCRDCTWKTDCCSIRTKDRSASRLHCLRNRRSPVCSSPPRSES